MTPKLNKSLVNFGLLVAALVGMAVIVSSATAQPRVGFGEVGRLDLEANKVVAQNGVAFAIDDGCRLISQTPPTYECTGRLMTLSIVPGSAPGILGQFERADSSFIDLTVSGTHGYLVIVNQPRSGMTPDYRLVVLDVSNPAAISEVNSIKLPFPMNTGIRVQAKSDALYASSSEDGLFVYDLSDPTVPVEVASLDAIVYDMYLADDALYVAGPEGLRILDVTTPTSPIELSLTPGRFGLVRAFGNQAFVTEDVLCTGVDILYPVKCGEVVVELDVTERATPITMGTITGGENVSIRTVAKSGNFLLVGESKNVNAFDLQVPDRARAAQYAPTFGEQRFGSPVDITVTDGLVIVTAHLGTEEFSIRILQLRPRQVAYLPLVLNPSTPD